VAHNAFWLRLRPLSMTTSKRLSPGGTEATRQAGMEHFSFVFTILFVLLGPVKFIPAFAAMTLDADEAFRKALATRGTLISAAVMAAVALAGSGVVAKYHISLDALRIAGGS
jgi:small neutral amino acid transporter SnatA (MarC family)